MAGINFSAVLD